MSRPSARVLAILERLVAFDTVSRHSNLALIRWVESYLAGHGIASQLIFDADGGKANLLATLGGGREGGIVLSGHTDVVPVDGQAWTSDPFALREADGKLFGRGTCDMKGYIAAVLAAVPDFLAQPLSRPIHLAFSYDEEVGCKGVHGLLDALVAQGIRPFGCIVGEPTAMRVVDAHKGSRNYLCEVRGLEAHAAKAPQGVNAIAHAARLICRIHEQADRYAEQGPFDPLFDVAHDTLSVNLVNGGLARNIVARDCRFVFGYRYLPQSDPDRIVGEIEDYARDEVLPRMRARCCDASIRFEIQSDNPPLVPMDPAWVAFVAGLSDEPGSGGRVSYMTEAGLYQRIGVPSVICGPGDIAQAHKPDEFVSLSQLASCERFFDRLRARLAAGES